MCTVLWGCGGVFDLEILEEREGFIAFRVTGKNAKKAFAKEAGGHRWQRVPPTEKRGRRQTSTVTVAVLPEPSQKEQRIESCDLEWTFYRSSGAGGQHRNKTDSAARVKHLPTGIVARAENDKSQHINKENALVALRAKLWSVQREKSLNKRNSKRREQVGSGMRGDKIRTVSVFNDVVHDHIANKKIPYKRYIKGHLEDLTG